MTQTSANTLQALLDDMQTMVAIIELDGTLSFVNNIPLLIANLKPEDVIGKKFWDCYWFNYDPRIQALIRENLARAAAGENIHEDMQARIADGLLWIEFSIHAALEKGKPVQLVAEGRDITARKEIENNYQQTLSALKDSEKTLALTLNSIGDGVITTDLHDNITSMNPAACAITGWPAEIALGQTLSNIFPLPNDTVPANLTGPDRLSARDYFTTLSNREGLEYQATISVTVIKDSENKVFGKTLVFSDITEQHRLREEARAAQQQLQGMFDGMQTMVAILDIDGRVLLVNNTPLLATGLEQSDVINQFLWACPWFTGNIKIQNGVRKDLESAAAGKSTLGDIQILTPEGWIWIEFSVHPVFDNIGNITQLVAEGHDPSVRRKVQEEREQALQELQKREQNLAITLDSIGDAVITTDARGFVTRMNPTAEQLTGWTFAQAENKPLKDIFTIVNERTGEPLASPVDKLMATGEIVHLSNHTTLIARDGSEYHIADSAAPIRDEKGNILGSILVFSDVTESYHLREKAAATQQQLQGLLDGMQTMVGIYDADGTVTFINNTPLFLLGIEQSEVLGLKLWECPWFAFNQASRDQIILDMNRAAAGESVISDVEIDTNMGKIWITFSAHPVFSSDGTVIQIVGEGRDITQRKTTENSLRSSEQQLRRYRDQAPLAAIEMDLEQTIVGWNTAAEKMFGYHFDDVKGRSVNILMPDTSTRADSQRLWDDLMNYSHGDVISRFLKKDGSIIYCQSHNAPFLDDDGHIVGACSILRDISVERAAQQALRDSEKTQRELLNSMVEGILVTDESGIISAFNQAAETLLGYSATEIVGQAVWPLFKGSTQETFDQNMARYIDTGNIRHIGMGIEINAICKNKKTFPTRIAIAELGKNPNGKRRFISSFRDLSDLKLQEEQLRRSQKMDALGKLTGGIAHDFNNLLGVVTGYAELLENALDKEEKLAQYAHEIHRAGERGAKLTRKLLSFSRHTSVTASSVDINALISGQQHMLATSLTPRINLIYELSEDAWPICIDSDDLEDAIINICINAMHAIEANGQIIINTRNTHLDTDNAQLRNLSAGDYLVLTIIDNGKGMDDETKERIFDPFFSTKGDKGTGLGLSQVYGFIERSKAAIDVASEPGWGTQFQLYFPRDNSANDNEALGSRYANPSPGGWETILVVDDELKLLELCTEILSQKGYTVLSAHNCGEALQLLDSTRVDLLLSDVIMPDMNGYELASIVAKKYPHIKIQMTSGYSDDRHVATGDNKLHHNLINKPYRAKTLLEKIRELLDSEA